MESISKNGGKRIFSSPPRPEHRLLSKGGPDYQAEAHSPPPKPGYTAAPNGADESQISLDRSNPKREDGRIKVFIRFREEASRRDACVLKDPDNSKAVVYVPTSASSNFQGQKISLKVFDFDDVLDCQASQENVFHIVARPIVDRFLQGFNGAILAYGQSGSGKTYTMEGALTDSTRRGIVARTGECIFKHLESLQKPSEHYRCELEASMIEVYCEKLRDLLCKDSDKKNGQLKIREDLDGNCEVEGATRIMICNENALLAVLLCGQQRRSIGETALNSNSSRSHSVLCLTLSVDDREEGIKQRSSLFFVDLAGSERATKSKCEGVKFEEGKNINQSLTTLGIVINALSNKESFVPYRDSKLTRILRGALGGNSLTALICCISTSRLNEYETLSTLKFGQRCARITNTVYKESTRTNEDLEKKHDLLLREIEALTTYATSLELWINTVGLKLPLDIYNVRSAAMTLPDLEIAPGEPVDCKQDGDSDRSSSLSSSSCDVETTCFPPVHSRNIALSRIGSSEREMRSSAADNRSIIDHRMSFANSFVDDETASIPRPLSIEPSGAGMSKVPCEVSPVVALISMQRQYQDLACRHAECKTELYKAEAEIIMKDEQIDTLEESLKSAHEQYNMLLTQYERISTKSFTTLPPKQAMPRQSESVAGCTPSGEKQKVPRELCSNHRHKHLQSGRNSHTKSVMDKATGHPMCGGHTGDQAHMDQSVIISGNIQQVLSPPTPPRGSGVHH